MKVDLTAPEKKQLQNALDSNKIRRWMQQKERLKFEIGDVVVKLIRSVDYSTKKETWKTENINSDNKMAQRYVYIYEDEYGIGYMKRLRIADGKLGQELICLTDFDYDSTRFEVDPEYAEHVLLDADFDIKQIHKKSLEARKICTKMNRKIGVKPQTLQDFNEFFEKLKVGDSFWISHDYTGRYTAEYQMTSLTKVSTQDLDRANNWDWRRFKERVEKGGINSAYCYRLSTSGSYSYKDVLTVEFRDRVFYTQKPAQEEKK